MTNSMPATSPKPNFPGVTTEEHAVEMLMHLDNAVPWDTTFLFLAEGCETVGQATPLAKAIETAMKASFKIWADSWIRPRLEDVMNATDNYKKDALRLQGATAMVEAIYAYQVKGDQDAPGNPAAVVRALAIAEGRAS